MLLEGCSYTVTLCSAYLNTRSTTLGIFYLGTPNWWAYYFTCVVWKSKERGSGRYISSQPCLAWGYVKIDGNWSCATGARRVKQGIVQGDFQEVMQNTRITWFFMVNMKKNSIIFGKRMKRVYLEQLAEKHPQRCLLNQGPPKPPWNRPSLWNKGINLQTLPERHGQKAKTNFPFSFVCTAMN